MARLFTVSMSIGFDEEVKSRGAVAEDVKILEFDFETVKLFNVISANSQTKNLLKRRAILTT